LPNEKKSLVRGPKKIKVIGNGLIKEEMLAFKQTALEYARKITH
jgi:hypothetical protein